MSTDQIMWTTAVSMAAVGLTLGVLVDGESVSPDFAFGILSGWFGCYVVLYARTYIQEWKERHRDKETSASTKT